MSIVTKEFIKLIQIVYK